MRTDQRHYSPNTFLGRTERNKRRALERARNKKNFYRKEEAAVLQEMASDFLIHSKTPLGISNRKKLAVEIPVKESFNILIVIIVLLFLTVYFTL